MFKMEPDDVDLVDLDLEEDDSPKDNTLTSLPSKSKEKYLFRYNQFLDWLKEKDFEKPFSEESVLVYFIELSRRTTPTTLWTLYSMLRATLRFYQNVDISKFIKLRAFLKRKAVGYKPKKTKRFTMGEINKFLQEAPDGKYLLHKVALIVSVCSACRLGQLVELKVGDVEYVDSLVLIKMKDPRSGKQNLFSITGEYYEIFKKYAKLRPSNTTETRFFLNYQNDRCVRQPVGKNKFGTMPQQVAAYLGLKEPKLYTGNCFKKSSESVIVDSMGEIAASKQVLRWEPPVVHSKDASADDTKGAETEILLNESSCSSSSCSNRSVLADDNHAVDTLQLPHDNTEVNVTSNGLRPPLVYTDKEQINYLADVLPCPPRVNDSAGQHMKDEATKIFTGLCPDTLRVKATFANLGTGKYRCSWRVDYEDTDTTQSLTNEQILTQLEARRPHYSKIIFVRKSIIPPLWSVEYGIMDCGCRDEIVTKPSESGMCDYGDVNFDIVPKSEDLDLSVYDTCE